MPALLDRRLIFVTGKGGVGRSTVAIALGLLAARGGARTIVAELAGQGRVRGAFGRDGEPFHEIELTDGLATISIEPEAAMEEYLRVKTGAVGQALGGSRVFQAFATATPGMRELLTMGKVWELAQPTRRTAGADPYDVVIVDAQATGHGLAILRTPSTFAEIARVGPIAATARRIAASLQDPAQSAVVAVATAEEMAVGETLWLADELADGGPSLSAVIANGRVAARFSAAETRRLQRAVEGADGSGTADGGAGRALGVALDHALRAERQSAQLDRLRDGVSAPVLELPFLLDGADDRAGLDALADALDRPEVTGR